MGKYSVLGLITLNAIPFLLLGQSRDDLYCGGCGKSNDLSYTFCYNCGVRLDKSASVNNLRQRIAQADSSKQPVVLTSSELQALVQVEVERALQSQKANQTKPVRPKTRTEQILDVAVPIAVGVGFLYFISTVSFKRGVLR